jgi:oxygen-independent coproporphyrinogen III oxidase
MTSENHQMPSERTTIVFDADLIQRYDQSGPRYTSYPTAVEFRSDFSTGDYYRLADLSNRQHAPRPLSLYIHLPFCATVCYYCACNKVVTNNRQRASAYLSHLFREIERQGRLFSSERPVTQLHWGGGTPTFLNDDQMAGLMKVTREHFALEDDDRGEFSIEVDPRETHKDSMAVLRGLGFNRLSLGVQDFDPRVQRAVNRIQSESLTLRVMNVARTTGFRSINVDLIYGLPLQTVSTFSRTVDRILDAGPDRISVFNYAHLPDRFKTQGQINRKELPSPSEKLAILEMTIGKLTHAGYQYIGMDHFAKPDDELAVAQRNRTLHRNFHGYSTRGNCDLIGMGVSAIGGIGNAYYQNAKSLNDYYSRINRGVLPIVRGIELDWDDLLRREVISRLICHFELEYNFLEYRYRIDFRSYFSSELGRLRCMEDDGLLSIGPHRIEILPKGRMLIRAVCMVFDRYLSNAESEKRFSKVI